MGKTFVCFYSSIILIMQIVEGDEKLNTLISFLKAHATEKHMLFCTTCAAVDYFATALQKFVRLINLCNLCIVL